MKDICPTCTREVRLDQRHCGYCTADAGYPNVRYATRPEEVASLRKRAERVRKAVRRRKLQAEHDLLLALGGQSRLVINRGLRQLSDWLESSNKLYETFYRRKNKGEQFKEDVWNLQRIAAENTISPHFFEHLTIAAISADGIGMSYYGDYSIVVREDAIAHRTTVFEENPFHFNTRHKVISGQAPPPGYRAPWPERGVLVSAKLGGQIKPGATRDDLADLLMSRSRGEAECDFVEAHVYGDIHSECIDAVIGPPPTQRADRLIWTRLKRLLAKNGARVTEI